MSTSTKTKKVTSKIQRAIGKVVVDANKAADKLEAEGVPTEVTRLIRPVVTAGKKVYSPEKAEKAKVMYGEGYSFLEISEALGLSVTTIRKYVANEDEVITLNSLSTLTLRIRTYKREGLSNVAIGQRVGVSESTVRRRLKQPLTEEETFLELMMDELANARDEIIENLTEQPLFVTLFGDDDGRWNLIENTIKRRASFTRREGRGQRMTFTLEFSAYRQPVRKQVEN